MLCALASGGVALVRAQHPEWPTVEVPAGAIVDTIIGTLSASAVDITASNPNHEGDLGAGRLDLAAAVALGPPAPTLGDLNHDGLVNGADLGILVASWGDCNGCPADLTHDGFVGGPDLGLLLTRWSP